MSISDDMTFVFDEDGKPATPRLLQEPDSAWCAVLIHEAQRQIGLLKDAAQWQSAKQLRIAQLWLMLFALFATGGFVFDESRAVLLSVGFATGFMVSIFACVPRKLGPLGIGLSDFNEPDALRWPVSYAKQALISTYEEIIRRWHSALQANSRMLLWTALSLGIYTFAAILVIIGGHGGCK